MTLHDRLVVTVDGDVAAWLRTYQRQLRERKSRKCFWQETMQELNMEFEALKEAAETEGIQ